MLERDQVKRILEAALLASGQPLKVNALQSVFDKREKPETPLIKELLEEIISAHPGQLKLMSILAEHYRSRGKKEGAIRLLQQCLMDNPKCPNYAKQLD